MDIRIESVAATGPVEPWEVFVGQLIHSLCSTDRSEWDGQDGATKHGSGETAVRAEYAMDSLLLENILCGGRLSTVELFKAVEEIEGDYNWSAELLERCESLVEERVSGLQEMMESFSSTLEDEHLLPEGSILGLALRSLTIRYRGLSFEEVCHLFNNVGAQAKQLLKSISEKVDVPYQAKNEGEAEKQMHCSLSPHPISFLSCWHDDQEHQQCIQRRLDTYMQSMRARDWPKCVKNHHDYFDSLPVKVEEVAAELTETEDKIHHEHLCQAVLQLSLLHESLGHTEVSKNILFEAIGLAQVSPDSTLLAKALGALQLASPAGSMESGVLADMFLAKACEIEEVETRVVAEMRKAWHGVSAGGMRPGDIVDHLTVSVELCQKHHLRTLLLQVRNMMSIVYRIFEQKSLSEVFAQLVLRWQEKMPGSRSTCTSSSESSWCGENMFVDYIEHDERENQLCQAVCQLARLAIADRADRVGFAMLSVCKELVNDDPASEARQLFQECHAELQLQRCLVASDVSSAARWLAALRVHNPLLSRLYDGLLLKLQLQLDAARSAFISLVHDCDQVSGRTEKLTVGFHLPLLKARTLLALSEVEMVLPEALSFPVPLRVCEENYI